MDEQNEAPSVSVVIPTYNEEHHITATLDSVARQTYPRITEVLVVDGRSTDRTREIVAARGDARLLDNPKRMQAAALNIGLSEAMGEVIVRVDGHCRLEPEYVERCVDALTSTSAAMVGGAMIPVASGWLQSGIAEAMSSRVGAGPARFHVGGPPGWVDTVYLGAYWTEAALAVCGYRSDVGVNEDAEFAHRMRRQGGVWFDPTIRSSYEPRRSLGAVSRQFWRYGMSRSSTVRRHPSSISPRQLAAPALVLGLLSPWRRLVLVAYSALVLGSSVSVARRRGQKVAAAFAAALPAMHLSWGAGFLAGLVSGRRQVSAR